MYRVFIVAVAAAGCGTGPESNFSATAQALCGDGEGLVCHDGGDLCVPLQATAAHVGHGDLEGPCNPIGTAPHEPPPPWSPQQPTPPQQLEAGHERFARSAVALNAPPPWSPQQPTPPQQLVEAPTESTADWTAQVPKQPTPLCAADEGAACGGTFGSCCDGLRCAWGVCLIDD